MAALLALACAGCGAFGGAQGSLRLVHVADVAQAVKLVAPPSQPDRLYVVQKTGRIRVLENGHLRPRPFLDIHRLVQSTGNTQGLLGLAFPPRFGHGDDRFYVDYTSEPEGSEVVAEYAATANGAVQRRVLLRIRRTKYEPHGGENGGDLAFGPDGRLYLATGDGGPETDPHNNAQNIHRRWGKLLRTNPRAAHPTWQIVAYGLRNPWGIDFDPQTGGLFIDDVGQYRWEELDYLPRSALHPLVNLGWSAYEGTHPYRPRRLRRYAGSRLVWPILEFPHAASGRVQQNTFCAIIGGTVYRGSALPQLDGRYLFGDLCSGHVFSVRVENGKAVGLRREVFGLQQVTSFATDARGRLWLSSLDAGVFRVERG